MVNRKIFIVGFGLYGSIHGATEYAVNMQVKTDSNRCESAIVLVVVAGRSVVGLSHNRYLMTDLSRNVSLSLSRIVSLRMNE